MLCSVEADIDQLYLPGDKSKAHEDFHAFSGTLESHFIEEKSPILFPCKMKIKGKMNFIK